MEVQSEITDDVNQIEEPCNHVPWGDLRICLCSVNGVDDEILHRSVSYIDNEFILNHVRNISNASASRMLLELPRCRTDCEKVMTVAVSHLKRKRVRLNKDRNEGGPKKLKEFLAEEFVFPPPTTHVRFVTSFHSAHRFLGTDYSYYGLCFNKMIPNISEKLLILWYGDMPFLLLLLLLLFLLLLLLLCASIH